MGENRARPRALLAARRTGAVAALVAALGLGVAPASAESPARSSGDDAAAAALAIGAIIALGVGVAIAKHGKKHDHHDSWDEDSYGQPFHPSAHVTCYPRQRKCFERDRYSHRWSHRIFGA